MKAAGLEYSLVLTADLDHGESEAIAACEAGAIPVVISGDGLIGRVGGALAGRDVPLGLIAGGRGNDFARVLGIPTAPAAAVAVLSAGHERTIDVGYANRAHFLCIASCGFDSEANRIANQVGLVRGPLVYAYAALRALKQWKPARFTVTTDGGEPVSFDGYSVVVGNSKAYGGGMFVAPAALLDDAELDVVITRDGSKLSFLRGLPAVFKGKHIDRDDVEMWRGGEVLVEADRSFDVYADGELITTLPARIGLLAASLRVIAPPGPDRGP